MLNEDTMLQNVQGNAQKKALLEPKEKTVFLNNY